MNQKKKGKEKVVNGKQQTALFQFLGLGMNMLVAVAITSYLGDVLDDYTKAQTPIFIWLFPFVVIIFYLIKIIKATSLKK